MIDNQFPMNYTASNAKYKISNSNELLSIAPKLGNKRELCMRIFVNDHVGHHRRFVDSDNYIYSEIGTLFLDNFRKNFFRLFHSKSKNIVYYVYEKSV